jgi:hypothetical protein
MIFRDRKTGTLLNIRRDDYTNDRMFYQEVIHVKRSDGYCHNHDHESKTGLSARMYSIPFQDLQSQNNYT